MCRWFPVLGVLLIVVAAGCVGPEERGDDDAGDDAPAPRPWAVGNSHTGCAESAGIVLLEPERLQELLPENFTVRDAGDFFELGVETGRGVLFFNSVVCDPAATAELAVYTNAPDVEGYDAADYDFYMLGYGSEDAGVVANLSAVGALAETGNISAAVEATLPVAGQGSADVDGGSAMRYAFEAVGATPQPFELTARFWQVVPTGLALWQYELPGEEAFVGALSSCTFPSGSLLEQILGQEDCSGLDTAAILFPAQGFEGEIRYLPGAVAR